MFSSHRHKYTYSHVKIASFLKFRQMGVLEMGNYIDWEQESYPQYEDFIVLPLFALFFPTVRYFLDKFLFEVCTSFKVVIFLLDSNFFECSGLVVYK